MSGHRKEEKRNFWVSEAKGPLVPIRLQGPGRPLPRREGVSSHGSQMFKVFLFSQRAQRHRVWGLDTVQWLFAGIVSKNQTYRNCAANPSQSNSRSSILFQDGIH